MPPPSSGGLVLLQTLGVLRSVCPSIHRLFGHVRDVAQSDAAVLFLGESGVGKELLARTLHELSPRRGRRLVVLVCTGLSAARLTAALYGEEPAAILKRPPRLPETEGPPEDRRASGGRLSGALTQASGGTLLLDDVAALDAEGQSELLRAVNSEPSLQRFPSRRGPRLRLLSTSTEDIAKLVRLGRFRPDLYHRLAAARLAVPPLRERRGDVALLAGELLAAAMSVARFVHNRARSARFRHGAKGAKSSGSVSGRHCAIHALNERQPRNAPPLYPTSAANLGSRRSAWGTQNGKSNPTTRAGRARSSSTRSLAVQPGGSFARSRVFIPVASMR
jgi:sigma54-dependent transcription regulator